MTALAVYLCDDFVGTLRCDPRQRLSFQYDPEWIARKDAPPLSLSLPLRKDAYPDEKARPFFANLLPESAVREAVARKLGISPRNEFALLEALGGECAGAITLLPPDAARETESGYRPLSPGEFHEIIRNLHRKPLLAGEEGVRLSLAGAQHKLPVCMEGERVFLPLGSSPSTHIVKPNIDGFEDSVRNEAFCMALAGRIGLPAPNSQVMLLPEALYVVERYDRYRDENGLVRRLHQEDFCQAMGFMAENKYEAEGGPSLADCFALIDQSSTNPALDRKALLGWMAFNYFIHNADAHAKNLSLLLGPDHIRLAPFYDLMCTAVYEGLTEKLAMRIGGENRPQWIQPRHWERMAETVGIGTKLVLRTVGEMAGSITHAAEALAAEQEEKWGPAPIIGRIRTVISRQVKHTNTAIG